MNSSSSYLAETLISEPNCQFFYLLVTLEYKRWPWENYRAPLLCYFKRCASFQSHRGIKSVVRVRKRSNRIIIGDFFVPCGLEDWRLILKKNVSFRSNLPIHGGVTVRKWPKFDLTSVTLTFDLLPWFFAWTSLLILVISPKNVMMIRWEEHCENAGVTDERRDGQNLS